MCGVVFVHTKAGVFRYQVGNHKRVHQGTQESQKIERKLTVAPHPWITKLCVRGFDALSHHDGRILGVTLSVRVEPFLEENKICQEQWTKPATLFVPLWRWVAPKGGWAQNFALFSFPHKIPLCVLSLGVFSLNVGGVWSAGTLQRTRLGYLAIVTSASGPALVMTASNAQPVQWALPECTKTDFTWRSGSNVSVLTQGGASTTMSNMKLTCGGTVVKKLNRLLRRSIIPRHCSDVQWLEDSHACNQGYSAVSVRLQLCQNPGLRRFGPLRRREREKSKDG